jgi:hypothetical protein
MDTDRIGHLKCRFRQITNSWDHFIRPKNAGYVIAERGLAGLKITRNGFSLTSFANNKPWILFFPEKKTPGRLLLA